MFIEPRRSADPRLTWVSPEQWHITTLFMAEVTPTAMDQLIDSLRDIAARTPRFPIIAHGGKCFPNPFQARLLYLAIDTGARELGHLSRLCRNAANHAGAAPDGTRFVPHLSLARIKRPFDATRWMQIVSSFGEFSWQATRLSLVRSHLGEGPAGAARHEVVERFELAGTAVGQ